MLVICGSKELINAVEWHCFHLFRFILGVLMPCFYNFRRMHPQKRIQFFFQIFGPTTRFVRTNSHYDVKPPKFHSSPLKKDGWKMILSSSEDNFSKGELLNIRWVIFILYSGWIHSNVLNALFISSKKRFHISQTHLALSSRCFFCKRKTSVF